jgi:hypothetical protein
MTATASPDSVDPIGGQRKRRTDELERWLTDLRVTVTDGTPDWLTLDGDRDDLAPASSVPLPTEDHPGHDSRTTAWSTDPSESLKDWPSGPYAGRHRAAD